MTPLRLAIIGCGAITEHGHLPAAAALPNTEVEVAALVDRDIERAKTLAARYHVPTAIADYQELDGAIDAAIIALPPALHAPVSIELLGRGIHILVEKPMGMNTAECDAMIAGAQASGARLAVGLVRRFQNGPCFARSMIHSGALGRIESVNVHEGGVFNWPVASPFFLKRETAGGGVLADAGVHALDLLLWWFGDANVIAYRDDAFGGVEADCELDLTFADNINAHVELSRTRAMRNTTIIRGQRGTLEIGAYDNKITLTVDDSPARQLAVSGALRESPDDTGGAMAAQLRDLAAAIRDGKDAKVHGREGRRSVALIETCYAKRTALEHPWVMEGIERP